MTPRPHVMTEIALRDSARRRQRRELRLIGAGLATAAARGRRPADRPARPRAVRQLFARRPADRTGGTSSSGSRTPGEITETVQLPGYDASAAFAALGQVFVRLRRPVPTIVKIDPATNTVVGTRVRAIEGCPTHRGPRPGRRRLDRCGGPGSGLVYRHRTRRSMIVTATIPVDIALWPPWQATGYGSGSADGDGVTEIDTATSSPCPNTPGSARSRPAALVFTGGSLWATTGTTLLQLNPDAVDGRRPALRCLARLAVLSHARRRTLCLGGHRRPGPAGAGHVAGCHRRVGPDARRELDPRRVRPAAGIQLGRSEPFGA